MGGWGWSFPVGPTPLSGQVIYIEKSKLNIADMWLILIDHVTNILFRGELQIDEKKKKKKKPIKFGKIQERPLNEITECAFS